MAANAGNAAANVARITVRLPVGEAPTELVPVASVSAIGAQASPGAWSVAAVATPAAGTCAGHARGLTETRLPAPPPVAAEGWLELSNALGKKSG